MVRPEATVLTTARTPVLYVHVADDGGLLVVDGETGRSAWITETELIRRLQELQEGGGAALVSREKSTPMALAILESIEARVSVVPASDVHPDAVRRGGLTSLMSAAYVGASELADDLLRRGADVGTQDEDGFTALMYAANGGQDEMAKLLIERGADLSQTDHDGSTALMFAAQHGHLKIVKRLLAAGADPSARRPVDGLSAKDFAIGNGHERVAAVLASVEGLMS